jgi:hypothetical protein
VASGQVIKPGGLQVLANNHNFIGGSYSPQIGTVCRLQGFSTDATGTSFHNMVMTAVPVEGTGRGLYFYVAVHNTDSAAAEVRLVCGSNTGAASTIAAGAATAVLLFCDTTASQNFVASVQGKCATSSKLLLVSGVFYWAQDGYSGSISDAPDGKSFVWAQTGEFADTFPLTVEQVNRFLGGPLTVFNGTPQSMGGLFSPLWRYSSSITSATYVEIGRVVLYKRRNVVKVKMHTLARNCRVKAEFPQGLKLEQSITGTTAQAPTSTNDPDDMIVNISDSLDLMPFADLIPVILYAKRSDSTTTATVQSINFYLDKS